MTFSVVHDCDPGNDDALATLAALGSAAIELKAVTTGAGHLTAARTARNAAITLAIAGRADVPAARGAEGPLVRERLIAQVLDFERGLDPERNDLPATPVDPTITSATTIARLAIEERDLAVVTTGPLTNLALALRNAPAIAPKLGRLVMLAGAWGLGNKTAAAEWNVLCDPEAAAIVFACGAPLTLIPIDAAAQVTIDDALMEGVRGIGGRISAFAAELLASLRSTFRPGPFGPGDAPLNDPLAILLAANSALARRLPARVEIELAGRHTYGRTVVDFVGRSPLGPNCEVAGEFDVAATRRAFIDALAALR
jgi:inosine-uridine nucleoside N-ribohydrolase